MSSAWTKVFDHTNRCVGHIRQTRTGRWQVKSDVRTKSFADWFEAHQWLLTRRLGVKWQVKTMVSHFYWTGEDWSEDRLAGKVFARKGDALACAKTFEENPWDRLCVVPFRADNWEDAIDGVPQGFKNRYL